MSKLDRLLNANEKILWSSRPVMKAFVLPALASIPFGLFFLAFAAFLDVECIFSRCSLLNFWRSFCFDRDCDSLGPIIVATDEIP